MRIGIIGAGNIGSTLAGMLTRLGHTVAIANSRGPETLQELAQQTGATAVTAHEAARSGDIVVVTIQLKNIPNLPKDLFEGVSDDVVVIDTSNYYPLLREGHMAEFDADLTQSEWVQQHLGRPVVKAFNNIIYYDLNSLGKPAGTPGRVGLPVAGDHPAAKQQVMQLIDALGFEPVEGGSLHESWRQHPGSPMYCTNLPAAEITKIFDDLGTTFTPALHTKFAAAHAAQEEEMRQLGITL